MNKIKVLELTYMHIQINFRVNNSSKCCYIIKLSTKLKWETNKKYIFSKF